MTKLKKIIKNNWMYAVIYTIGFTLTILAGWLLGRPNMLHATAFSGSSITYNEGKQYEYINGTEHSILTFEKGTSFNYDRYRVTRTQYNSNNTNMLNDYIYTSCYYDNPPNLVCSYYYSISFLDSGSKNSTSGTYTFNLSNDYVIFENHNYTLISSGYTQEQYEAYGQQQYNAGYSAGVAYVQAHPNDYGLYTSAQYSANYTAGQNSVINSPNTYGLYTQAQYEANYTSGYNAGIAYVQANPAQYNLYTANQYNAYGTSQYNAGVQYVVDHPSNYNLYTSSDYIAYGDNMYNAGISAVTSDPNTYNLYTASQYADNYTAGQNSVINSPNTYGLYTQAQYNAHAQEQYNAGYSAGLIDNTASYNAGIQYVLDNPSEYNLFTIAQYNAYGTSQYNAGIQYVVANPSDYNLYTQSEINSYYSEGYQDGILQGENNVISNPNDYDLYTESQYLNNSDYSNFVYNSISSVWVNRPYYDSNLGYYQNNWLRVSKELVSVTNNFIDLSDIYSSSFASEVTDIEIVFNRKFTSLVPLYINNDSTDIQYYSYTHVDLSCYNNVSDTNRAHWQKCPTFDTSYSGLGDSLSLDYSYLINGTNYFDVLYSLGDSNIYDISSITYNSIVIGNYTYTSDSVNVLDGHVTGITFDISGLNLESYNFGYVSGYSDGRVESQPAIYNDGYQAGYDKASDICSAFGTSGNTLTGLAGSIIMSPISMFKQIFDFNFLGVNLAGFFLSIITLLVSIWLIKRLL